MRKVVAGLFISLDGVVESPDQWQFDTFDDDMSNALSASIAAQDAILLGRVTYEEWAPYWPTADDPFADFINNTPKFVASTTLTEVTWQNSTLLKGDVVDEVARLKREPGKDIGTAGSPGLVRSLLYADLVDELVLIVHPVIVGSGKRLITDGSALKRLQLADSVHTSTGAMILTYRSHSA